MLYSEFIQGTGCKDNEKNYKVYKDLEVMYMNSDLSKDEIYEYGKKLVDNSKSEAELRAEARIKEEIANWKKQIEYYKDEIEWKKMLIDENPITETDIELNKDCKRMIKYYKEQIKDIRSRVRFLKDCLE